MPGTRNNRWWGVFAAILCLAVYLSTGQSLAGNDTTASVHLVPRLIRHATPYFTVNDNPKMFAFVARTENGISRVRITDWNMDLRGTRAREAFARGELKMVQPKYFLAPTRHEGKFASTFGLGAGLFALPIVGPVLLVIDLENRLNLLWWLAKFAAATSVAGTVFLLFLSGLRFVGVRAATVIALAYGLGTCAFSVSSQALWQHGPCEFFVALGAYYLLVRERRVADFLCGLGFALAVVCRPTVALVSASTAVYLLVSDRSRAFRFALGALPVAVAYLVYNYYTFGSPWTFGELGVVSKVASTKTGSPDLWQTPLHVGLAGLLLSPARGLLVYSPIALFSIWGAWDAFRDASWKNLRPLTVGVVLQLLLAAKWFDWWGGWCFGYRIIVDVAVLLALLALPVVARVVARPWYGVAFFTLLVYSVGVQVLGAYFYDLEGWNNRDAWQVLTQSNPEGLVFDDKSSAERLARERGGILTPVKLNIDNPRCRDRLWSINDSPLAYYLSNLRTARARRQLVIDKFLRDSG